MPEYPSLVSATQDELDALADLPPKDGGSGYKHVYRKRHSWQAKSPVGKLDLGTYSLVRYAVTAVCEWMRGVYGPDWPRLYRRFGENPIEVTPVPTTDGTVWVATVWGMGTPHVVFPPGWEDGGPDGWPSKAEAELAAERYVRDTFGLFAEVMLRKG